MAARLIDLHTDWLLQYAPETTVFDPALYPRVPERLKQADGYLQATRAAVLSCFRDAEDWARQSDPWRALGDLITRIEAEFSGRLLIGPDDAKRWQEDREGLTWAMIGVEGFDALIRSSTDLDRLPALFGRGVRLFQPLYTATSLLGGSSQAGDDRGLSDLGRAFLETLDAIGAQSPSARPIFDLAHMNPRTAGDALAWFEADASRGEHVLLVYSHGALAHAGYHKPRAITPENLSRLRALGGWVGLGVTPPFYESAEAIKASIETAAAIPRNGQAGYEGIAIGTDFLGVDRTLPDLGNAEKVVDWLEHAFPPDVGLALIQGNAESLLLRAMGVS